MLSNQEGAYKESQLINLDFICEEKYAPNHEIAKVMQSHL